MWDITSKLIDNKFRNHKECAKRRGISCTLTRGQLKYVFETNKGVCDYTGRQMQIHSDGMEHDDMPTIERISEFKGYTLDNIALVRRDINSIKRDVLETKQSWRGKKGLSIEVKEMINSMCKVIYNPVELDKLKTKYVAYNKGDNTVKANKTIETSSENPSEAPSEEIKINQDVYLSENYSALGKLVGAVATFELSFTEYKRKFSCKKDGLTGKVFHEVDKKALFWLDKTQPFSNSNTIITNEQIADALDKFMVESGLNDLTSLKKLCKVISSK